MKRAAAAALATAVFAAGSAFAEGFEIRGGKNASLIRFVSKAAMESFEGRTTAVSGLVSLDPAALGDTLTIHVLVDMATLDTGIALRNEHMRENHLHTEEFPVATFAGARITKGAGSLTPGIARRVELAGTLTIHGVARTVTVPVDLTWNGAEELHLAAEFPVALADHEIPRPKFLLLKLGEVQKVVATLVAQRVAAPAVEDTAATP
jgi:polyisoprenoid-binding protein YceI